MDANQLVLHSPVGFVIAFGAGVISFLSPCVLPLVPSYLSMMSGVGVTELQSANRQGRARLLRATLLFVAGFTVVFAALEATASSLGRALSAHQVALDRVAGIVIIAAGLLFAGLVSPRWLLRERRFHVSPARLGDWGAPVMGMAFAFGWTPCIGPVLAAVLALASSSETLARGEAMLVVYSLGLGVPFVAAGLAFGRVAGFVAFSRRHMRAINVTSGLALSGLGVLLLTGELHVLSSAFTDILDSVGLGRLASV